jgi:hypothetical protein
MEIEGTFKIRKRAGGRLDVGFDPKEHGTPVRRSRGFSGNDGMRRYLLDVGVKSDKIPTVQELQAGRSVTITDIKVDSSRIAA